jgi:hypothetical protein
MLSGYLSKIKEMEISLCSSIKKYNKKCKNLKDEENC